MHDGSVMLYRSLICQHACPFLPLNPSKHIWRDDSVEHKNLAVFILISKYLSQLVTSTTDSVASLPAYSISVFTFVFFAIRIPFFLSKTLVNMLRYRDELISFVNRLSVLVVGTTLAVQCLPHLSPLFGPSSPLREIVEQKKKVSSPPCR